MRRLNLILALVLGSLVSLPSSSALATTDSYEVSACNYAPGAVNNSWVWATSDPSQPDHYAEHANCPYSFGDGGGKADQEGGLSTTDALGLSSGAPPGTSASWTFTAPAGTTIIGLTYERYIGHELDPDNYWSPALYADGALVPGETCVDSVQNGETCFVGGPPGTEPVTVTGLTAHQLSLGIACQAPAEEECVTGATLHAVWAATYGATVTLSDPTPPTLSTPSGALWGPGEAGGVHNGTENVTVSAQDVGGGVRSIVLSADGHPIETYNALCDFTFPQPCPLSTGAQTLTLPTTELSDGTHTLTLVATDAAGNHSTIASEQITIDNNPPSPATPTTPPTPSLPSNISGGGNISSGGNSSPPKATIRVSETLLGRELIVYVSGPATGEVRVGFIGRLLGRTVASDAKTMALKHGRLTVIFKLGPRTAAQATIRVSAKLDHELAVTSTLHRRAHRPQSARQARERPPSRRSTSTPLRPAPAHGSSHVRRR
jgi:hypothetical protein